MIPTVSLPTTVIMVLFIYANNIIIFCFCPIGQTNACVGVLAQVVIDLNTLLIYGMRTV